MQTTRLMTADELLAMPDDGFHRHELVRGELLTMSPSGARHGVVTMRITVSLSNHVAAHGLGQVFPADVGFVLSREPDTVRAPDVAFVSNARMVRTDRYFPGPPDLAVEVISPTDTYTEVDEKVREYIAAGSRLVIVVNPRTRTATITTPAGSRHLTVDDSLTGGDVIPGWSLPLRELFAD